MKVKELFENHTSEEIQKMFGYESVEAQLALCAQLDMDVERYLDRVSFSEYIGVNFDNGSIYMVLSAKYIQLQTDTNECEDIKDISKEKLDELLETVNVTMSDEEILNVIDKYIGKHNPSLVAVQTLKDVAKFVIVGFSSSDLERLGGAKTPGGFGIFG